MGKRLADCEINHENWNDELTPVESGTFDKADSETLSKRKILSVRSLRSTKTGTSGLFKSFTGFSNAPNSPSNASFNFGSTPASGVVQNGSVDDANKLESQYVVQLRALNQSLVNWIGKQVDKDAQCILSPIFVDYEKHLKSINNKYPQCSAKIYGASGDKKVENVTTSIQSSNTSASAFKFTAPPSTISTSFPFKTDDKNDAATAQKPTFTFGLSSSASAATDASASAIVQKPTFSFGFTPTATKTESTSITKPTFSFGLPPSATSSSVTTAASSPFRFTLSQTSDPLSQVTSSEGAFAAPKFSFATPSVNTNLAVSSQPSNGDDDGESEEYVPPKPQTKEIKEEGSVYQIRCKLFYKSDDSWTERGLGNLYVKPVADQKFQLLIRADTNLGNILLNVLITKDIPITQQDNTLKFVCVPSPPMPKASKDDKQPVLLLVRVKTKDAATELLKQMDEQRGMT